MKVWFRWKKIRISIGWIFRLKMHFFHGCFYFLLRELNVANNELCYLPDSMAQMTELVPLDLKLVLYLLIHGCFGTWKFSFKRNLVVWTFRKYSPEKFNMEPEVMMLSKAGISELPGTSDFRWTMLNFRGVDPWKYILQVCNFHGFHGLMTLFLSAKPENIFLNFWLH